MSSALRGVDRTTDTMSEMEKQPHAQAGAWVQVAVAWTLVGVPLAWGIYKTLEKALVLFR